MKLYFVQVIERLSAFLEICNKYEVISSDSCNSVRVLKRRIALADAVLIICSADTARRYRASAERSDIGQDSETMPIDDIFYSAIKIIKRDFQTEFTQMKFRQIILPCCHDGRKEYGVLDLKVKKTYQLMEFIQELWETNQTISCISDSNADDFRKCYEVFKELERAAGSTNCCLKQCRSCRNKTCQHDYGRNVYKEISYDSGIAVDDSYTYCSAEAPLAQSGCAESQMAYRNSQCHIMGRSADRVNCSGLEIEPQLSTVQCKLLQRSKKEIDLTSDDYFFFESRNSSSESISSSCFISNAVKLNDEFDRNLQADGIDNARACHMHLEPAPRPLTDS